MPTASRVNLQPPVSSLQPLALDDPATTAARREVILAKPFLRRFYLDAYRFFVEASREAPAGLRLEIGSGAGFLKSVMPDAITSDFLRVPGIDLVADGRSLPFADESLAAIYMLDAFHHVPDVAALLSEASRCLKSGGVLAMVEPANTPFGRFIFSHFHHEPFDPGAAEWEFAPGRPLSMANGALPWIVFVRDLRRLQREFPLLSSPQVQYCHPLLYLLSGGFSHRSFVPGFTAPLVQAAEWLLAPANRWLGMFMRVVVRRL